MTRRRQAVAGSAASPGLTLVEMLVVLVLASLLGTLIVQGTGFFLARYDAVDRTRRESSLATLREHWFASTVAAMVPSRLPARRFTGDNAAFEGVSLQPLSSIGGRPVRIRWSIDATRVLYTEPGLRPWTVLSLDDGGTAKASTSNNGTLCDAEGVEIETTVSFPLGLGYGCDAVEKTYTLTCNWNTRGNRTNAVGVALAQITLPDGTTASNIGDFVSCKVE